MSCHVQGSWSDGTNRIDVIGICDFSAVAFLFRQFSTHHATQHSFHQRDLGQGRDGFMIGNLPVLNWENEGFQFRNGVCDRQGCAKGDIDEGCVDLSTMSAGISREQDRESSERICETEEHIWEREWEGCEVEEGEGACCGGGRSVGRHGCGVYR